MVTLLLVVLLLVLMTITFLDKGGNGKNLT